MSERTNLPDRVSEDVDYHEVRVDYLLSNRLKNGNSAAETATNRPSR
ncbi:MAG TPA: hypothetical protein VJ625_04985 [Propionibacteriaceae bacterium]|nr:hypothetical protein [Propionibacteriaceae bacterium]